MQIINRKFSEIPGENVNFEDTLSIYPDLRKIFERFYPFDTISTVDQSSEPPGKIFPKRPLQKAKF